MKNEANFVSKQGICYETNLPSLDNQLRYTHRDISLQVREVESMARKLFDSLTINSISWQHHLNMEAKLYTPEELDDYHHAYGQRGTGIMIEFRSPLSLERSITPVMELLKEDALSTMELLTKSGKIPQTGDGTIQWTHDVGTEDEAITPIGIWWTDNQLTEYDGVFDMPKPVRFLLEKAGIKFDDFEEELGGETSEVKFIQSND